LEIPRVGDVLLQSSGQRWAIDLRIEITLTHLEPPQGSAACSRGRRDARAAEPIEFVGWLGLFGVLQSLTSERVDPPPP
jgi:hypothetical protein